MEISRTIHHIVHIAIEETAAVVIKVLILTNPPGIPVLSRDFTLNPGTFKPNPGILSQFMLSLISF